MKLPIVGPLPELVPVHAVGSVESAAFSSFLAHDIKKNGIMNKRKRMNIFFILNHFCLVKKVITKIIVNEYIKVKFNISIKKQVIYT